MIEVEFKIPVRDLSYVEDRLRSIGAVYLRGGIEVDYYLKHPCRDFKSTDEALRVRVSDDRASICYKGPRISLESKTRVEVESEVSDYKSVLELFRMLGFGVFATIRKYRKVYRYSRFKISLDHVYGLGDYIEVEESIESTDLIPYAEERIKKFIVDVLQLSIDYSIKKSYLELYLEKYFSEYGF